MDFNGSYSFDQNALDEAVTDIRNSEAAGWPADFDFSAGWLNETGIQDAPPALDQSGFATLSCYDDYRMTPRSPASATWVVCDWPGCQSREAFLDDLAKSFHITNVHVPVVLEQWPGKCQWPGCISKSIFQKQRALELHVTNIHTSPLLCDVPGCKHPTAFSKQGQLDRHKASIHKIGRLYRCPFKGCPRNENGFPRKDKLKEHMRRNGHEGNTHCEYDHCEYKHERGFSNKTELQEHKISDHGIYECEIGSCKGSVSAFTRDKLRDHLFLSLAHDYTLPVMSSIVALLSPTNKIASEPTPEDLTNSTHPMYDILEERKNCIRCEKFRVKVDLVDHVTLPGAQVAPADPVIPTLASDPQVDWDGDNDFTSYYNMKNLFSIPGEGQEGFNYL